jgi:vanillin dehydrogenase
MRNVELLIGGVSRGAKNQATFDRKNPISKEVVTRAAAATCEDADDAVSAAHNAFRDWAALAPSPRRAMLLRAADLLEAKTADFIEIGVQETGGAPGWYGFNASLAAEMLREAASMTSQISGEIIQSNLPGSFAMAVRQPAGVVMGIAP